MKIAVLCNGPSRTLFTQPEKYDFIIGCNIPWTKVDATIVLDEQVVRHWAKNPESITCPAVFSRKAWMETDCVKEKKRDFFVPFLIELVDVRPEYDSSGHHAVKYALRKGAKGIDIYGCDSWWAQTIVSHTHKYIKNLNPDDSQQHVFGWRKRWLEIIDCYPDVTFNFIGEPK
jgi:hypothetical protein